MTEWKVEKLICKYSPNIYGASPTQDHKTLSPENITYKDLKRSYELMANIVTEHGQEYLPIFARLHEELESHSERRSLLSKAFDISNEFNNQTVH